MNNKEFIKKKYSSDRYKVWKNGKTIFVYDRETKQRKAINKEIEAYNIVHEHKVKGSLKTRKRIKTIESVRAKKSTSLRYSHLFACNCIVRDSDKYKNRELPRHVEHYYYYSSQRGISSFRTAKRKHNKDYPDHQLLKIEYIHTKVPTH